MDFSRSYSASWRVFRVNRDTWADGDRINDVDSFKITKTADGSLLESGNITVTGEFEPDYYRVVMTAEQGGEVERIDLATLLFDVTGGNENYGRTVHETNGHSVLYPASITTIIAGEYAPAGVNGANYAAQLLRSAINAPVEVEGSFVLNDHVVHEIGSNVLEAVWNVLEAGGFVIQIDGKGVVHIRPKPTEPSLVLTADNMRLLTNGVDFTTDISEIPNRYVVIVDQSKVIAANNDPRSSVSTVSRGYCVDQVDESPTTVNGETYTAYAERKLKEASVMIEEHTYTRELAPDVNLYSIIRASISALQGDLRVSSQTVSCDHGITIQEKAYREIPLW